jgi:hypothetical protein
MKKMNGKLSLNRETLIHLHRGEAVRIAGGTQGNAFACIGPDTNDCASVNCLTAVPCNIPVYTYPWC